MNNSKKKSTGSFPIKTVREEQGLTQEEFSKHFGISLGRLRDWEQGRSDPDEITQAYLTLIRNQPAVADRVLNGPGLQHAGVTFRALELWAKTRDSQASLPLLLRRLVCQHSGVLRTEMPGGEAISMAGWDGFVNCDQPTPWIPAGQSYWELSNNAGIATKASDDYNKRTKSCDKETMSRSTYVFATARHFPNKQRWIRQCKTDSHWADVRVYDSKDLEHWLESCPSVALWFAEQIGIRGAGIESLDTRWSAWAHSSYPVITPMALVKGREESYRALVAQLSREEYGLTWVRADSMEEALAFAIATLLSVHSAQHASRAVIVTNAQGWRFVEANPDIDWVLVANPQLLAAHQPTRKLRILVASATTALESSYRSAAMETSIEVERPSAEIFEEALEEIGIEEADAGRLTRNTSRSWSVFRRVCARNPEIQCPAWLTDDNTRTLSLVCLVGAWSRNREGDRVVIERIANRNYEQLDEDLVRLAKLDDPPVMRIGHVWIAKSPLELLHLIGPLISDDQLNRYFDTLEGILSQPDPVLELEPNKRWMAAVYEKVREESSLLIKDICDSMVKLSAIGSDISQLEERAVGQRIDALVYRLLNDADSQRWLSLSSLLRPLAEASPAAFLDAVEVSLNKNPQPIVHLISETTNSTFGGGCWYADLLWALELLAWEPRHFARIVDILANLSNHPIQGNWSNTPASSLLSLFRAWMPQTTASLDMRISVLDRLIDTNEERGWELLCELGLRQMDSAIPNARPNWNDYDTGAGRGVSGAEFHKMLAATGERLIMLAQSNPIRIAKLVENIEQFDESYQASIFTLVKEFGDRRFDDDSKDVVCSALRKRLHWQLNYGGKRSDPKPVLVKQLTMLYDELTPSDPLVRNHWLFSTPWPDIPEADTKRGDHGERLMELRLIAAAEIYEASGLPGLYELIHHAGDHFWLGRTIEQLPIPREILLDWIISLREEFSPYSPTGKTVIGIIDLRSDTDREKLINQIVDLAKAHGMTDDELASFLILCRRDSITWAHLETNANVKKKYWETVPPHPCLRDEKPTVSKCVEELLAVNRPQSAFNAMQFALDQADPTLIHRTLKALAQTVEPDVPLPDAWHIEEALDQLEASGECQPADIARLEFQFVQALDHSKRGLKSLNQVICEDPVVFVDLIQALFKPENAERDTSEMSQNLASHAWRVLTNIRYIPGQLDDNEIDSQHLTEWVRKARQLCSEADRKTVGESQIGEWLARSPQGKDGIRPHEALRPILDASNGSELRRGFNIGLHNSRGVTSRAYNEGGNQERTLSDQYASDAAKLQTEFPRLAAELHKLAGDYARQAGHEDAEAKLRIEGRN